MGPPFHMAGISPFIDPFLAGYFLCWYEYLFSHLKAGNAAMPSVKILATLANPATTYWLRDALKSALLRDPVDALHDAEELAALLQDRLESDQTFRQIPSNM